MAVDGARRNRLILVSGLLMAAVLAIFSWSQYSARVEAERTLGLAASRIISAHFSSAAAVKVGSLQGRVQASSTDKGFLGLIPSQQTMTVPYSVDYFVDASKLGPGSYRWNPKTKILTIDAPDVTLGEPNIDEAKGVSQQGGWFISRRAALELARQVAQRATLQSRTEARKPEHLNRARESARRVMADMAAAPLKAAGVDDVRVAVSFPWEPKDLSQRVSEQWDVSRSVEDVLDDQRKAGR